MLHKEGDFIRKKMEDSCQKLPCWDAGLGAIRRLMAVPTLVGTFSLLVDLRTRRCTSDPYRLITGRLAVLQISRTKIVIAWSHLVTD